MNFELGVQRGEGGTLGSLGAQDCRIVQSIDADDDCLNILFQAWHLNDNDWYLNDNDCVLAGKKSSVLRRNWPLSWPSCKH